MPALLGLRRATPCKPARRICLSQHGELTFLKPEPAHQRKDMTGQMSEPKTPVCSLLDLGAYVMGKEQTIADSHLDQLSDSVDARKIGRRRRPEAVLGELDRAEEVVLNICSSRGDARVILNRKLMNLVEMADGHL